MMWKSGLCIYQVDGGQMIPLYYNPSFCHIMGYSEEYADMAGRGELFPGVHPDDAALLRTKVEEAARTNGMMEHTYRMWNDSMGEYRYIHLELNAELQDGVKLLYGVYSDVSEYQNLEKERIETGEKLKNIMNAIPGGVAIYKVTNMFETVFFSEGVPGLTGYTGEEYRELIKQDAAEMIYDEDTDMVLSKAKEVIRTHMPLDFEFRKRHRDGHIVWVRVHVTWIGQADGSPLLHCVFHNITDLKEAQLEMNHLLSSIPGGIASYRVEGKHFIPTYYSDGVMALSGHTKEEFDELIREDAFNIIYEGDRERVMGAAAAALESGAVLDISYRMYHRNGNLIWIHLNGRRIGPLTDHAHFYAVFTGMSAETRLFQSIIDETADCVYVIDKENCDLLYANESHNLSSWEPGSLGRKCYFALHKKKAPCPVCVLKNYAPDGEEHDLPVENNDRSYTARFRETDWNGIPAYVVYVRDVTGEVRAREEKKRLEMYFQTMIRRLPGGITVIRSNPDGSQAAEFISDGFLEMTRMTLEEAEKRFREGGMSLVHPDDVTECRHKVEGYIKNGSGHCDLIMRMRCAGKGYIWTKSTLSLLQALDGARRFYVVYTDITKTMEEKEEIRHQYEDILLKHYHRPGPDALLVGHCNISKSQMVEIIDHTGLDLLGRFGSEQESFFQGLSGFIVDEEERRQFADFSLTLRFLEAYQMNQTERKESFFIKLPQETCGRYVQFKMNLVETPDTGDITGIFTVTDITGQTILERNMHQLSVANYDLTLDVDLVNDQYTVITLSQTCKDVPQKKGNFSRRIDYMMRERVVDRDKERVARMLAAGYVLERLKRDGSYSFSFAMKGEEGDIRTKNIFISASDLRLGRICMARTDITESVREQQGPLNVIAYTFEMLAMIHLDTERLTLYTRQTVLENLPPFVVDDYDSKVDRFAGQYGTEEGSKEAADQFRLRTIQRELERSPGGYDFVLPYRAEDGLKYKQINVLWGDSSHKTVSIVRADVTDVLAAEHRRKEELERALAFAEKASQAKSEFLASMSHDIRTPMNAIMGMTTLAIAHMDEKKRVEDYLNKIAISSRHLLSLINDILDMSQIEQAKITLNNRRVSIHEMTEQLKVIMLPQAREGGIEFDIKTERITHPYFYGDDLRISQIMINLLGNAIKFTSKGGSVTFIAEEIPAIKKEGFVRYRFTVQDTGIGMTEEFQSHLFKPFTRDYSISRIEGTGLGLSITKGLVDLMKGSISVKSKRGEGSVFQVELECETAPDEARETDRGVGPIYSQEWEAFLEGRCFLVAEDNEINAEILCEMLKMQGATADVEPDGKSVVEKFRTEPAGTYDAILMDIQMPNMNGYDATREIRFLDRPDAKSIPIIAMTANAFSEDIQAAMNAGMTAHIAKPVDIGLLRKILSESLSGSLRLPGSEMERWT